MDEEKNQSSTHFPNSTDQLVFTQKTKNKKKYPLLSYHHLPDYMKDNEFILNYYRVNWPLKQAFFSLFRWHNETLNVWTHLLGFLLFLGLTVVNVLGLPHLTDFITMFNGQFTSSVKANISKNPVPTIDLNQESHLKVTNWPFYVFLSGAMFCLISSSTCHLFCCHSRNLNLQLIKIDYVGIAVMIITSFFPPIFYIFKCTPHWQIIYLSGISILGTITILTLLSPTLSTGKYRPFRAFIFVSMGLFGFIPAVHGTVLNWNDPHRDVTLAFESIMALSYLIGTVFYVSRIPERWKPGSFDLAGQSHQIFHLFVVMGALAHYTAAQILRRYRGEMEC